eukprot:TRINITY_DN331_c2_g3_i1.p1 TRINITY_DN331_c2_g3~~TRINITY_DN331_c2_g3_i1.p1  ORF type:complete len:262 (+),score=33.29 TRINITY_DN331_c2_g3_i1:531-1316(+)
METIIRPLVQAARHPEFSDVMWDVVRCEGVFFTFAYFVLKKKLKGVGIKNAQREAKLKTAMTCYNVFMTLYSFVTFLVMTKVLLFDVSLFTNDCDHVFRNKTFVWTTYIFYLSKYFEYLDTFWIVMRGKRVSFLQCFHHVGAPWCLWFLHHYNSESVWVFATFNSFIHTIMYAYYTAATFKIHIPGKSILTSLQIAQFLMGLYLNYCYYCLDCMHASFKLLFAMFFGWFYVGAVLLLFINFFIRSYVVKKPSTVKEKKKEE